MNNTLEIDRTDIEKPVIAVLGATSPNEDYIPLMGWRIGRLLRDEVMNGSICTGGVEGVGLDVYCGFVDTCLQTSDKPNDRFFVAIPTHTLEMPSLMDDDIRSPYCKPQLVPYSAPKGYQIAAKLLHQELKVLRVGADMAERRKKLAEMANIAIAINGGMGTLEEIVLAASLGARVFIDGNSGGACRIIAKMKHENLSDIRIGRAVISIPSKDMERIDVFTDIDQLGKMLSEEIGT